MNIVSQIQNQFAPLQRQRTTRAVPGILVAVSGGVDSMALSEALASLKGRLDLHVGLAHIDHRLRPSSVSERRQVVRFGAERDLPVFTADLNLSSASDSGSLQARARTCRYAALFSMASAYGFDWIATAHHADDRIETAILNAKRGAGLQGLTSLRRVRYFFSDKWGDSLGIWRPLLGIPKTELVEYARQKGVPWIQDPTNATGKYTRNRIRRSLSEFLEPTDAVNITRTIENLTTSCRALEHRHQQTLRRATVHRSPDSWILRLEDIATKPRVQLQDFLAYAFKCIGPDLSADRNHLTQIAREIERTKGSTTRQLTCRGGVVRLSPPLIWFTRTEDRGGRDLRHRRAAPVCIDAGRLAKADPLSIPWFGSEIRIRMIDTGSTPTRLRLESARIEYFDATDHYPKLMIHGPGDDQRFTPFGFEGTKTARDVLKESKVPEPMRWQWPCLAIAPDGEAQSQLMAVLGLRRSNLRPVDENTTRAIEVSWHPDEPGIYREYFRTANTEQNLD